MRSVLLMVLFFGGVSASAFCNSNTEGSDECVLLHDYSDYQWASYLTNTYIQQKSNGRHICEYRFATYCWYQCMIETYGEESGIVYGSCSCSPGNQRDPDQDLPSECYSPDGSSCRRQKPTTPSGSQRNTATCTLTTTPATAPTLSSG